MIHCKKKGAMQFFLTTDYFKTQIGGKKVHWTKSAIIRQFIIPKKNTHQTLCIKQNNSKVLEESIGELYGLFLCVSIDR